MGKINKWSRAVKIVGLSSFFLNCSSLIVFSYFAVYLKKELHISFSQLGFLDGCVDFLSYVMRFLSGFASDLIVNRKLFFLIGITLVVLAKPLEAIFRTFLPMFATKIMERIGNGIQATPRDALISDYSDEVSPAKRAEYFGIRQAMGSMGSLVGSILACVLFWYFQDFQTVFWCSVPVGLIAVLITAFCVKNKYNKSILYGLQKEKQNTESILTTKKQKFKLSDIKQFNREYWILLGITSIYFIAKVSDSMALLYAIGSRDIPIYFIPLFFVVFHIGAVLASYISGLMRGRIKQIENLFLIGIAGFIVALILFIWYNTSMISILLGMALLGAYSGLANGMFPSCVSNLLPEKLRGTGHGIYNVTSAISLLLGGSILGIVSDKYDQRTGLCMSCVLALISMLVLLIYKKKKYV